MRVHQDVFTPMRGHVDDGCVVDCENGDVLTIKAEMSGWSVVSQSGERLGSALNAWGVERVVVNHGKQA